MSYKNGKSFSDFRGINLKAANGCLRFEDATVAPATTTGEFLLYVDGGVLYYDNGSSATALGGGGGGSSSLDGAYDVGRTITVNQGSVVMAGVTETTAVLSLTGDGNSSGALLTLAHTTATRKDIDGTGSSWSVTGQGAATLLSATVPTIVAGSSGNVNLTIDAYGTGTIAIGATSTGAVTITPALTLVASATITGTATTTVFTITAGDAVLTDGSVDISDADNAASLAVTNSGATTVGAVAAGGVVQLDCATLTTGALLSLELTEGTLNGGWYLRAWDVTASAAVFTLGEDGEINIAGTAAGTDAITVTAGDILLTAGHIDMTAGDFTMADGSITVTDADNAASLTITNNTATSASVIVLAGSGVFTGSTTTSFLTVTPSGMTTGTAVYLPLAAMTTGNGIHAVANALTTGNVLSITSSATAIATTGRLLSVVHSGATGTSAVLSEFSSAATDETTIVKVTASAALAAGKALHISAAAMTTGTALYIAATEATITTGKYIECFDGAANDFSVAKYGATVIAGNATGTAALTLTAGDITLTNGDVTLTDGDIILTANASKVTFTGTGANGGVITNLKNSAASGLSGTQLDVEILIGATPYYFTVYPTKA